MFPFEESQSGQCSKTSQFNLWKESVYTYISIPHPWEPGSTGDMDIQSQAQTGKHRLPHDRCTAGSRHQQPRRQQAPTSAANPQRNPLGFYTLL